MKITSKGKMQMSAEQVADVVLQGMTSPTIVVAPLVWIPAPDGKQQWYFVIAKDQKGGVGVNQIKVESRADGEQVRAAVIAALMRRPPIIVIDSDDEMATIKLCEELWPGEKVTSLRQQMEREEQQTGHWR